MKISSECELTSEQIFRNFRRKCKGHLVKNFERNLQNTSRKFLLFWEIFECISKKILNKTEENIGHFRC